MVTARNYELSDIFAQSHAYGLKQPRLTCQSNLNALFKHTITTPGSTKLINF